MSHFSRIRTQIVNRDHLIAALQDLGYTPETGDLLITGYRAQTTGVEVLVRLPSSAPVGFRKAGDTYELIADWAAVKGIRRQEFADRLARRYAVHAARAGLEQQGFHLVEETEEASGQIRLVLRRLS